MYFTNYASPLGEMTFTSDRLNITGAFFNGQKHSPKLGNAIKYDDLGVFEKTKRWFDDYFNQKNPKININLKAEGSVFQHKVWKILSEIPYGKTITYGEIASKISPSMSAQAVGGAVGRNPIAILIPCHRVVGSGGKLTGYAGGIDKKAKLLNLEKNKYY